MTRRDAIGLLGTLSLGTAITSTAGCAGSAATASTAPSPKGDLTPSLASGSPTSPERLALVEAMKQKSAGIETSFEALDHRSDWTMPYRLFRPKASGQLPLVVYLHGSGGQGTDNLKQMGLGNVFGSRVWSLAENQERFPCYVVVPQTDRGWIRYAPPSPGDTVAKPIDGLGDGARLALELIESLGREFPIDRKRIYLTGQSMGGGGAWHLLAQRPRLFAAAVICCGSATLDPPAAAAGTPLWNLHGDADATVPVSVSRTRLAAVRSAGGHPVETEYAGVGHNVWDWAYTEPDLLPWLFGHRRG